MSFWRLFGCIAVFAAGNVLAQTPAAPASTANADTPAVSTSAAAPAAAMATAEAFRFDYAALEPGDPAAGQAKTAVCAACHGMDGNPATSLYPRLAGQNEHYIAEQLAHFKTGARTDPVMGTFAQPLSAQDMRDIGAWYASQKPTFGVADEALVEHGRRLYRQGDAARGIPACMACHGPAGLGNPGAPYPHLAGQFTDYVVKKLKAWRDDEVRWGKSANATIMPAIASRLTDQDMAAVASYIEGLHPVPLAASNADD